MRAALDAAGFWDEFETDWVCLDCELMPWSAKAQELLRQQYAAVGAAAARRAGARRSPRCEQAAARGVDVGALLARYQRARRTMAQRFVAAYRRYCWPVQSLDDLKLAPFHLLATEGKVHIDQRPRLAHGDAGRALPRTIRRCCCATPYQVVDVTDPASEARRHRAGGRN